MENMGKGRGRYRYVTLLFACLLTSSSISSAAGKSSFLFFHSFPVIVWVAFLFFSGWALLYASMKVFKCWLTDANWQSLSSFTDSLIHFLLCTFDYPFQYCGVIVKLSNLQWNVFFQLLCQGRECIIFYKDMQKATTTLRCIMWNFYHRYLTVSLETPSLFP